MKSIMVDDLDYCIYCGSTAERHHIFFGTSNRAKSDKYGFIIPLCPEHHRVGSNAPHMNRIVDLTLKCWAQNVFEKEIGTRQKFRQEFGKSYL